MCGRRTGPAPTRLVEAPVRNSEGQQVAGHDRGRDLPTPAARTNHGTDYRQVRVGRSTGQRKATLAAARERRRRTPSAAAAGGSERRTVGPTVRPSRPTAVQGADRQCHDAPKGEVDRRAGEVLGHCRTWLAGVSAPGGAEPSPPAARAAQARPPSATPSRQARPRWSTPSRGSQHVSRRPRQHWQDVPGSRHAGKQNTQHGTPARCCAALWAVRRRQPVVVPPGSVSA